LPALRPGFLGAVDVDEIDGLGDGRDTTLRGEYDVQFLAGRDFGRLVEERFLSGVWGKSSVGFAGEIGKCFAACELIVDFAANNSGIWFAVQSGDAIFFRESGCELRGGHGRLLIR